MIRRLLIAALLGAPLAACQTAQQPVATADDSAWYVGSIPDKPHNIPLVDRRKMDAKYARQTVEYKGPEKPGSIVVDIDERMLYLVQPEGKAIRYGVGVGKQGFSWRGIATVGRKGVWPNWSPTKTMVGIKPDLPRYMEAGLDNPLGARARSICTRTAPTRSSASTAPTSPGASASRSLRAACACSTRTSPISTSASQSAPRST
jgi:lipoprotein-anchoring transpeptidase ErfK/SrfK